MLRQFSHSTRNQREEIVLAGAKHRRTHSCEVLLVLETGVFVKVKVGKFTIYDGNENVTTNYNSAISFSSLSRLFQVVSLRR